MTEFLLIWLGITCLSLAMDKHYKDTFLQPVKKSVKRVLTWSGWGLLALTIVMQPTKGIEYVVWCCNLSMAIVLQAWLLSQIKSVRKNKKSSRT